MALNPFKLLVFILVTLQPAESLTFDFSSIPSDLTLQGDASISNGALNLNRIDVNGTTSVGRATHPQPLQIWDSRIGRLNNFTTLFKFSIRYGGSKYPPGDGLAFFMSPVGSKILPNSGRGFIGLFNSTGTPTEKIVAVEFDTFRNNWDPPFSHIGFDVNSIEQAAYVPWLMNSEETRSALLSYDSNTMNLKLELSEPGTINLSYVVDLRKFLPEFVKVRFSASTGFDPIHMISFNGRSLQASELDPTK